MAEDTPTERIVCSRCHLPSQEPPRQFQQDSPFEQYLGTPLSQNESVSPPDLAHLRTYIRLLESDVAILDLEVSTLRLVILALEEQRDEATAELDLHKGLLCRVHDLPTELLCQIFLYCLDSSDHGGSYDLYAKDDSRIKGRTAPWDLTAVCRRWREVGTHMPRLWNAPSFVARDEYFDPDRELDEWNWMTTALTRAGEEPFTLDIDLDNTWGDGSLEGLYQLFDRVETLYLTGHPVLLSDDYNHHRCPELRKLSMTARISQFDIGRLPPASTLDWNDMFSNVSSSGPLQELTLRVDAAYDWFRDHDIPLDPSQLPFPLQELTTLTLDRAGRFTTIIPLLCLCPSLSVLSISGMNMHWSTSMAPFDNSIIALPSLQSLELCDVESASILSRFRCPQLRRLTASEKFSLPLNALESMLSHSRCALQEFDIQYTNPWDHRGAPYSSKEILAWQKILPLLCHLKIFTLRFTGMDLMSKILPVLAQPKAFPLLSSLIMHFNGYALGFIMKLQRSQKLELDAETLEHFLNACIHKADGSVLRNLDIHLHFLGIHIAQDMVSRWQDSRLLAQVRRWIAEGVNVEALWRITDKYSMHENNYNFYHELPV
ncbi:hypothetical protein CYLTODRAFT_459911 [Cylindrobasidium torrendii FP15055 ss-10]|uniref:Uncharacterized protein n=1 Tax=Cylindrobasidium torrendii FP15055 ss-10 TaxID=1314674 RepID=A0A0D7AT36_9AGAR|nr:hypothetical protein CYLTODRAFT_459911 [Cylindrobasidium torrendii FP15055 ss-10]